MRLVKLYSLIFLVILIFASFFLFEINYFLHLLINILSIGLSDIRVYFFLILAVIFVLIPIKKAKKQSSNNSKKIIIFILIYLCLAFIISQQIILYSGNMPSDKWIYSYNQGDLSLTSYHHIHTLKPSLLIMTNLIGLNGYDSGAGLVKDINTLFSYFHLLIFLVLFIFLIRYYALSGWHNQPLRRIIYFFASFGLLVSFFDAGPFIGQLLIHFAAFCAITSKHVKTKFFIWTIIFVFIGQILLKLLTGGVPYWSNLLFTNSLILFIFYLSLMLYLSSKRKTSIRKKIFKSVFFLIVILVLMFLLPLNKSTIEYSGGIIQDNYYFFSEIEYDHVVVDEIGSYYLYTDSADNKKVFSVLKENNLNPFYKAVFSLDKNCSSTKKGVKFNLISDQQIISKNHIYNLFQTNINDTNLIIMRDDCLSNIRFDFPIIKGVLQESNISNVKLY